MLQKCYNTLDDILALPHSYNT